MSTIFIVIPILFLLMFDLGLTLKWEDFKLIARQPRAVLVGEVGQLLVLPVIAFALAWVMRLEPVMFVGVVLIACCPGGSSSNVFSMLAHGDVALSVTLTALSSILTLITVPIVLALAVNVSGANVTHVVHLPVGNLLVQNLVLMFVPIVLGVLVHRWWPTAANRIERVLSRIAFPALMLLAGVFFAQNWQAIVANFGQLGLCVSLLILSAIGVAWCLSRLSHLDERRSRTIVIEVGMQNAAQAIAIASSPFIFNNDTMAIPAILYALVMNVVLLTYVGVLRRH
ncbi:MAG: bile acid:sodium symporter family protein [Muribaculaceae bacterium]|nr:bile acid:sodium symporter family protein [Muribaculaceae bacterium]